MKNKKGFTLIELLVVVLIIGILAAIALPKYEKAVEKSRIAEAKIALNTMKRNYELCVLEFGNTRDNECTNILKFIRNLSIPLSGEFEDDYIDNCPSGASPCFKTKDWIYDTEDNNYFHANRMIGENSPYWLTITYSDGSITCHNDDTSSKDYCKMICGGNECTL